MNQSLPNGPRFQPHLCSFVARAMTRCKSSSPDRAFSICDSCITVCDAVLDLELGKNAHQRFLDIWQKLNRHVIGLCQRYLERLDRACRERLDLLPCKTLFTSATISDTGLKLILAC